MLNPNDRMMLKTFRENHKLKDFEINTKCSKKLSNKIRLEFKYSELEFGKCRVLNAWINSTVPRVPDDESLSEILEELGFKNPVKNCINYVKNLNKYGPPVKFVIEPVDDDVSKDILSKWKEHKN